MTENSNTPAHKPSRDSLLASAAWNGVLSWGLYLGLAGIAVAAWLLFGMLALAITATALVFICVAFFVGSLSERLRSGLIAGALAALPVALFFLWLLK